MEHLRQGIQQFDEAFACFMVISMAELDDEANTRKLCSLVDLEKVNRAHNIINLLRAFVLIRNYDERIWGKYLAHLDEFLTNVKSDFSKANFLGNNSLALLLRVYIKEACVSERQSTLAKKIYDRVIEKMDNDRPVYSTI